MVVCGLAFGAGWAVAVFVIYPPPPPPADTAEVPDLVGRPLADARRILTERGLEVEETRELPHPSRPPGMVVAQSPLAGQQLRLGAGVRLAVSSGPSRARVPDLVGLPLGAVQSVLARAGFDIEVEEVFSTGPEGRVLEIFPLPGGEYALPERVTLTVSRRPVTPEDTLAMLADSLGLEFGEGIPLGADSVSMPGQPGDDVSGAGFAPDRAASQVLQPGVAAPASPPSGGDGPGGTP